jgi:hypothetical protein
MAGSFCRYSIEKMESLLGGLEGVSECLGAVFECSPGTQDTAECQALFAGINGIGATVAAFRTAMGQLGDNLTGLEALAGISAEKPQGAEPGPMAAPA